MGAERSPRKRQGAVDALTDASSGVLCVTFNKIVPRPRFLDDTVSPARETVLGAGTPCRRCEGAGHDKGLSCAVCGGQGFTGRSAEHWVAEQLGPWAIAVAREMTPHERTVCEQAGAWNWHDWSRAMWGVKWDAVDGIVAYVDGGDFATLCFDTPWGPPDAFHGAFVAAHPDVSVVACFYYEPNMQIAGYL